MTFGSNMIPCPHCGTANSARKRVCFNCQQELTAAEQQPPTAKAKLHKAHHTEVTGPRSKPVERISHRRGRATPCCSRANRQRPSCRGATPPEPISRAHGYPDVAHPATYRRRFRAGRGFGTAERAIFPAIAQHAACRYPPRTESSLSRGQCSADFSPGGARYSRKMSRKACHCPR